MRPIFVRVLRRGDKVLFRYGLLANPVGLPLGLAFVVGGAGALRSGLAAGLVFVVVGLVMVWFWYRPLLAVDTSELVVRNMLSVHRFELDDPGLVFLFPGEDPLPIQPDGSSGGVVVVRDTSGRSPVAIEATRGGRRSAYMSRGPNRELEALLRRRCPDARFEFTAQRR